MFPRIGIWRWPSLLVQTNKFDVLFWTTILPVLLFNRWVASISVVDQNHFSLLIVSKVELLAFIGDWSLGEDHLVVLDGDLAIVSAMGQLANSLSMLSLHSHGRFLVQIVSHKTIVFALITTCKIYFLMLLWYLDTLNWLRLKLLHLIVTVRLLEQKWGHISDVGLMQKVVCQTRFMLRFFRDGWLLFGLHLLQQGTNWFCFVVVSLLLVASPLV